VKKAVWRACPALLTNRDHHETVEDCWYCSPWRDRYPACPDCGTKLGLKSGKALEDLEGDEVFRKKCKVCKGSFEVDMSLRYPPRLI
jgi:hypothetical protein